jgi:hypothetical protein
MATQQFPNGMDAIGISKNANAHIVAKRCFFVRQTEQSKCKAFILGKTQENHSMAGAHSCSAPIEGSEQMTTNFSGSPNVSGSAKIYAFPPRGRFAISESNLAAEVQLPRGMKVTFGSGWYHDEAIQESERAS